MSFPVIQFNGAKYVGERFILTVETTGTGDFYFQWLNELSMEIRGASGRCLSFVPKSIDQSGTYLCEVRRYLNGKPQLASRYVAVYNEGDLTGNGDVIHFGPEYP